MYPITSVADLHNAIKILEVEKLSKLALLKEQYDLSYEALKPANLIKGAFNEMASSPYLSQNLVGSIMGVASGYLSNKLLLGGSKSKFGKIIGAFLQFGVTNLVANHADAIRSFGHFLFDKLVNKEEEHPDEPSQE